MLPDYSLFFFFSSRRRHTRYWRDWSSDVCSSDLIYEHCLKALNRGLKFGTHNLPLMGSGDWNDGMSTVGNKGQGESVWLAWFLYSILNNFIPICEKMNDIENIKKYTELKEFIRENTRS